MSKSCPVYAELETTKNTHTPHIHHTKQHKAEKKQGHLIINDDVGEPTVPNVDLVSVTCKISV